MILKRIIHKYSERVWTTSIWLMSGAGGGFFWSLRGTLRCLSRVTKRLLTPPGLCPGKLANSWTPTPFHKHTQTMGSVVPTVVPSTLHFECRYGHHLRIRGAPWSTAHRPPLPPAAPRDLVHRARPPAHCCGQHRLTLWLTDRQPN
jgi:hypothetical protein